MLELIWVTREGHKLLISQMETGHIENCIAKIRRSRRGWRREYLPRLELELQIRDMGLRN
jgi:hypothetical protein